MKLSTFMPLICRKLTLPSLFMVLLVFPGSGWANPSLETLEEMATIIKGVESKDLQDVSAALNQVNDPRFYYSEVFDTVEAAFQREMIRIFTKGEKPNSYVIQPLFDALGGMATQENGENLAVLRNNFAAHEPAYRAALNNNGVYDNHIQGHWVDFQQNSANPSMEALPSVMELVESTGILFNKDTGSYEGGSEDEIARFKSVGKRLRFLNLEGKQTIADQIFAIPPGADGTSPSDIFIAGTVEIIRDSRDALRESGMHLPVQGRDPEIKKALRILARLEKRNFALIGPAGAGKTAIAQAIDDLSASDGFGTDRAMSGLKGLLVVETSSARIGTLARSNDDNSQAAALEMWLDSAIAVQEALGRPILIYFDEAHQMSGAQVEALKRYMTKPNGLLFGFSSTPQEFNISFKDNPAFMRRIEEVGVEELSLEVVFDIIKNSWAPLVSKKFGVQISDELIKKMIKEADVIKRINGRVDGSKDLIQDLAIRHATELADEALYKILKGDVANFIKEFYALPVDPNNPREFNNFIQVLKINMNGIVAGQERMVDDIISLYQRLVKNRAKAVASGYIVGTTGVGKTFFATELAKLIYNNSKAFFEINGNEFQTGGMGLNSLVGAPNGVVSSDKTAGTLMEWLDDPGRGKNGGIILVNEADKMDSGVLKRIMELLDRGQIMGGDGKMRYAKNLMVLFTSNRNAKGIFPDKWNTWTASEMKAHIAKLDSDAIKEKLKHNHSGGPADSSKMADEITGRMDLFTLATPITPEVAREITEKLIQAFVAEQKEESEVDFIVEDSLADFMSQIGFSSIYGARPLLRVVDKTLQDLSLAFLIHDDTQDEESGEYVSPATFKYDADKNQFVVEFKVKRTKKELRMAAPKLGTDDPMSDPEFVKQILGFEDSMKAFIFGQDEMIERLSQAMMSHMGSPQASKQALSVFLVGSTGTGKSETAKAMAHIRYGSRDRAAIINLGEIRWEGDINKVFNPPPGFESGKNPGLLEQALINNPEGGVILFDEISNMGSGNEKTKTALFQQLYAIMDEPTWTSTATGATYDLTKFVFLMTGNDGEDILMGVGSDDLRVSAWKDNSSRAKVYAMLKKRGIPEAFLGRLVDAILQKPLTRDIVGDKLAPKFIGPVFQQMEALGFKVNADEQFANMFGNNFFSQGEGGRSVRKVAERHLSGLFVKIRGLLALAEIDPNTVDLEVSIKDNLPKEVFVDDADGFERVVELNVVAKKRGGKKVHFDESITVTEFADAVAVINYNTASRVAFHEVGHGYVNAPEASGKKLAFVTLRGRDDYLGYARYEQVKGHSAFTREALVQNVASVLAGSAAQQMAGFPADSGMRGDLTQARQMTREAIVNSGIFPAVAAKVGPKTDSGNPLPGNVESLVQDLTQKIFEEAWTLAVDKLESGWNEVNNIAHVLLEKGEINGGQFEAAKVVRQKTLISLTPENLENARAYLASPATETTTDSADKAPISCVLED